MDYSKDLNKLVNEMGFNRMEAQMALEESRGDINIATNKLTSGAYAPPPYAPVSEKAAYPSHQASIGEKNRIDDPSKLNFSNVLGNITGKHNAPIVEDKPSAPSFTSLTHDLQKIQIELPEGTKQMPPPYEVIDKSNKVKAWEKDANVFHFDCSQSSSSPSASRKEQPIYLQQGERCDVCFNILEGTTNILSQNKKVFHGTCFRKKFGPKCAYCCFPLSLPDKDHDLSGKYLMYKGKDYHVECYEKYAGPRCTSCFNVIIERPNGEFSGSWIMDGSSEYHTECYQKKLHSLWRAQNT